MVFFSVKYVNCSFSPIIPKPTRIINRNKLFDCDKFIAKMILYVSLTIGIIEGFGWWLANFGESLE